ncbi:MAG: glucose-6-phosphate isomerase [Alphaproteobacteria bacterium]|nr:glucose-6-phosphate isomerase [Alphaproteobacteria bacterium]
MKTITFGGLDFDFSRTDVSKKQLADLMELARARDFSGRRKAMFSGAKINTTSDWAVLHTALRAKKSEKVYVDGRNVVADVHAELERMAAFSEKVRCGRKITDIVHIGIGGSLLGPKMVTRALEAHHMPHLKAHFVSDDVQGVLKTLSPATTLFVVVSKTFTTPETLGQAEIARKWANGKSVFVAVTANPATAAQWGVEEESTFRFWDWVGGRYSTWSAVGITPMIMAGVKNFYKFLEGGRKIDAHFKKAPLTKNIPVMMALIGMAHRNFFKYLAYASIPYPPQLEFFPAWLQQLDMESNGKSVELSGRRVKGATGPVVFGCLGYDAQHSFFQWLHQGTDIVPVEFITSADSENCVIQADILFKGQRDRAHPRNNLEGGRPSTLLKVKDVTPESLGMLMALYEHKIFTQGALWNINSFDQCGVEIGKVIKKRLLAGRR